MKKVITVTTSFILSCFVTIDYYIIQDHKSTFATDSTNYTEFFSYKTQSTQLRIVGIVGC